MRFALLWGQAPAQLATRKCWPITCKTPRRCTWLPVHAGLLRSAPCLFHAPSASGRLLQCHGEW